MPARKDFLRHIVNRVLASSKLPRQVVDDIRRMVGRAEDKYKFHAFGGDIRRLAEYLRSQEFNELIMLVKSVRVEKGEEPPVEVLKRILLEAREAYKDIPEVVAAIDERLKELEGETVGKKTKIETLAEELKAELEKIGAKVALSDDKSKIEIRYRDNLHAEITYSDETKTYTLSYKVQGTASYETVGELKSAIRRLVDIVAGGSARQQ